MGYTGEQMSWHGFRAMASTLLNELGVAPDVIELQLAHRERNQVRAAYNRAQRLDERAAIQRRGAPEMPGAGAPCRVPEGWPGEGGSGQRSCKPPRDRDCDCLGGAWIGVPIARQAPAGVECHKHKYIGQSGLIENAPPQHLLGRALGTNCGTTTSGSAPRARARATNALKLLRVRVMPCTTVALLR